MAEEVDGSIFSLVATEDGSSLATAGNPPSAIIAPAAARASTKRRNLYSLAI